MQVPLYQSTYSPGEAVNVVRPPDSNPRGLPNVPATVVCREVSPLLRGEWYVIDIAEGYQGAGRSLARVDRLERAA